MPEVEQDGVEADLHHRAGLRLPRLGAGRHGREDKVAGEAKAAQSRAAKVGGKGAQEGITGRRQGTFGGTGGGGGGCCVGGRGEQQRILHVPVLGRTKVLEEINYQHEN